MKLLKKILMASLCSLMVLSTSMTSFAGVIGKSSSKYPKVVMGAPADADTYLNGAEIHMLTSSTKSKCMDFVSSSQRSRRCIYKACRERF